MDNVEEVVKLPRLDPTPTQILHTAHAFMAFSIIMGAILFFGATALTGFFCVLVWAIVKDLIWDMTFETTTFWEESLDAFVYTMAGAAMLAFCYWRNVGVR